MKPQAKVLRYSPRVRCCIRHCDPVFAILDLLLVLDPGSDTCERYHRSAKSCPQVSTVSVGSMSAIELERLQGLGAGLRDRITDHPQCQGPPCVCFRTEPKLYVTGCLIPAYAWCPIARRFWLLVEEMRHFYPIGK